MKKFLAILMIAGFIISSKAMAAEYNGYDIDGESFSCTAYSYDTGNYYYVTVEFSGSDVTIYFDNGGYITVTIDDEVIDDPSSISAYDYDKGAYWDLDVDLD
ncbi:MAG: hypothetical protein ABIC39_07895 [Pseudomonadota bacterium]